MTFFFFLQNNLIFHSSISKDRNRPTTHPKFETTGVRTHTLYFTTVHFMSLKTPAQTILAIYDFYPDQLSIKKKSCVNEWMLQFH